jgi:hypothetical protein
VLFQRFFFFFFLLRDLLLQAMTDDVEVWVQIEEAISSFFLRSLQRIQPVWDILLIPATYADFNPATIDIRATRLRMRINNDSWVDGLANFGKGLSQVHGDSHYCSRNHNSKVDHMLHFHSAAGVSVYGPSEST